MACLLIPVRKASLPSKRAARLWRSSRLEVYVEGAADTAQLAVSADLDSAHPLKTVTDGTHEKSKGN